MSKRCFHACAMADININDVEDFFCDVNMAITDFRIRSPDINVDATDISIDMLKELYFTENPDFSRVYLDFDICCESEAVCYKTLDYLQKKTASFSTVHILYETSKYL